MFSQLFLELKNRELDTSLVNILSVLDDNPNIAKINNHLTLKYETAVDLINLLNDKTKIRN